MKCIERVHAQGLSLRGDDIDTDQIMPSRFLSVTSFAGIEAHVFADARHQARLAGRRHPLDQDLRAQPRILVVNRNFGCGSSREHAAQALLRCGVVAILGESFGEIFAGNAVAAGLPCACLSAEEIQAVQARLDACQDASVCLDLRLQAVHVTGLGDFHARIPEGRRRQFLDGRWDAVACLLEAGEAVDRVMASLSGVVLSPGRFPR